MLISPAGYPQPAFNALAAALFYALDRNVQPVGTSGLEVSKMSAYRTMGGLTVSPFYGQYTLPTYASIIPIDLVPNQPQGAPVISWKGWHQYLIQKIMAEPEATFWHLQRVFPALNVRMTLNRADFPAVPFAGAEVKEATFKTQVAMMARGAMGGRALGSFGAGSGSGHASSGTGKLAARVGLNILNATMTGGNGGGMFFPPSS